MSLAESWNSPFATLFLMALAGLVMCTVIGGLKVWQRRQQTRTRADGFEMGSVENTISYRRCVLATAAAKTQPGWDRHVRPMLATVAAGTPAHDLLGERLFQHIDLTVRPSDDHSRPGPGREALVQILTILEGYRATR